MNEEKISYKCRDCDIELEDLKNYANPPGPGLEVYEKDTIIAINPADIKDVYDGKPQKNPEKNQIMGSKRVYRCFECSHCGQLFWFRDKESENLK